MLLDHLADGQKPRADDGVHAHIAHHRNHGRIVDQHDGTARTQALGQKTRHEIRLMIIRQSHEGGHLIDLFFFQQRLIGSAPPDHQDVVEFTGGAIRHASVILQHDNPLITRFKTFGQSQTDGSGPVHHDATVAFGRRSHQGEHIV